MLCAGLLRGSRETMVTARINEIHYDNTGGDVGELIEIRVDKDAAVAGYSVVLYNGSNGTFYDTLLLSGATKTSDSTHDFYVFELPSNGLQNGSPDGLALVDGDGNVVEFLSYEGTLTAANGPAAGLTSTDIGVAEPSSTPVGFSLERRDDGSWEEADPSTAGEANDTSAGPIVFEARINEIHYDNSGSDTGEFIEIRVDKDAAVPGYSVVLYNGNGGSAYNTLSLSDATRTSDATHDFYVFELPQNGLQNGSPDGIALVDSGGGVVEFLSYEGSFTASDGPAAGLTSTDIGVSELGDTSIGDSLERLDDGTWESADPDTKGAANGISTPPVPVDVLIHDVQGAGDASPLVGQIVTVEAIVVGDFQDGAAGMDGDLNGFYVQEEDADADADSLTSEGIFIFDGSGPAVDVSKGDLVRVTGTVVEFFGLTELTGVSVSVISSGNALPTPGTLDLPADDVTRESLEGMLVQVTDTTYITEYFNYDRFGEMVVSVDDAGDLAGDGRLDQYTQYNAPDASGFAAYQDAIEERRLIIDDGRSSQNPVPTLLPDGSPYSEANGFRGGDTFEELTGVLDYNFGEYKLQPVNGVSDSVNANKVIETNPRPESPPDVGGSLTVASLNVFNFFTTLDEGGNTSGPNGSDPRGADNQTEFDRQIAKLTKALSDIEADIFGLVELENEFGDQNGDGKFAIDTLVATLNQEYGTSYAFVDPGRAFVDTGDAISNGFIYDTRTVELTYGTSVEILDDSDLPGLGLGSLGPLFDGASSNRAALAATFTELATGGSLTLAVNHFKSKGAGGSSGLDEDQGDGAGAYNQMRLDAAVALDAWLGTDPTGSGDEDVMILGDLNAYAMEDPIQYLIGKGYTDLASRFAGPDNYSYVFDGQMGTLDYALTNGSLLSQVTGAAEWHINADEPDILDYDLSFNDPIYFDPTDPFRSSDHDPVIVGLRLEPEFEFLAGTDNRDFIEGTDANEIIATGKKTDTVTTGDGSDILDFTFESGNGRTDVTFVTDFDVTLDKIAGYTRDDIKRENNPDGDTQLTFDDGDKLFLYGVASSDEIVFVESFWV